MHTPASPPAVSRCSLAGRVATVQDHDEQRTVERPPAGPPPAGGAEGIAASGRAGTGESGNARRGRQSPVRRRLRRRRSRGRRADGAGAGSVPRRAATAVTSGPSMLSRSVRRSATRRAGPRASVRVGWRACGSHFRWSHCDRRCGGDTCGDDQIVRRMEHGQLGDHRAHHGPAGLGRLRHVDAGEAGERDGHRQIRHRRVGREEIPSEAEPIGSSSSATGTAGGTSGVARACIPVPIRTTPKSPSYRAALPQPETVHQSTRARPARDAGSQAVRCGARCGRDAVCRTAANWRR